MDNIENKEVVDKVKESDDEILPDNIKQVDNLVKTNNNKGLVLVMVLLILTFCGGSYYFLVLDTPVPEKIIKIDDKDMKSEYRMSGNSLEDFDLYFLKLENEEENKVYSPLSIKYALAMLSEGAGGNTKAQIDAVIGDYISKKYSNNKHMSFANAMFIRNSFKKNIKNDYTEVLTDKYNAEIRYDDFINSDSMNDWVSKKTFNLVNDLFDDRGIKDSNFVLVNALAIDMNWINRIQRSAAELPEGMNQMNYKVSYRHERYSDYVEIIQEEKYPKLIFNGVNNIKSVQVGASFNHYDIINDMGENTIRKIVSDDYRNYLNENPEQQVVCPPVDKYVDEYIKDINTNYKRADVSTDFYISDTEEEKVFAKDLQMYDGVSLQYVGIMPKKERLSTYIENIDSSKLSSIISEMKKVEYDNFKEGVITNIKGNIPLFKYDYTLDLKNDLKELNIVDVFDINKSDLSNMLKRKKQFINDANHKTNIEFSNDGIKAAAVTSTSGEGATSPCNYDYFFTVPVEIIDITFDKPYLYVIRDKSSGEVWFVGTVYEPIQQ